MHADVKARMCQTKDVQTDCLSWKGFDSKTRNYFKYYYFELYKGDRTYVCKKQICNDRIIKNEKHLSASASAVKFQVNAPVLPSLPGYQVE